MERVIACRLGTFGAAVVVGAEPVDRRASAAPTVPLVIAAGTALSGVAAGIFANELGASMLS